MYLGIPPRNVKNAPESSSAKSWFLVRAPSEIQKLEKATTVFASPPALFARKVAIAYTSRFAFAILARGL